MEHCNGTATPYCSGLVIDRLPTPESSSLPDPALTKEYQKLMSSYVWLNGSTRPDLCVVIKLLTQFNSHPLPAHLAAARYVLQYLHQSRTRGISYSSTGSNLSGSISYPCTNPAATGYTDASWGPQDASTPSSTDTIIIDECRSLHGAIITGMGGAISWQQVKHGKSPAVHVRPKFVQPIQDVNSSKLFVTFSKIFPSPIRPSPLQYSMATKAP